MWSEKRERKRKAKLFRTSILLRQGFQGEAGSHVLTVEDFPQYLKEIVLSVAREGYETYKPVSSWVSGINTHPCGSINSTDFTSFISFLRVPALIDIF